MGLSAPKNRSKLSHDPNNTAWSRNTQSFGHKILSSQGWAPGQTLGAEGAAHAQHYTAGSNSHIRVLLKDDQLGLGAKRGGNNAETFGLSLFSGILGRLNGKSEVQLEKEQTAQRDVELALYQSRKNGYINFVSAGFLVGDRIDKAELVKKEELEKAKLANTAEVQAVEPQGTKRKRAEDAVTEDSDSSSSSSSSSSDEQEQPTAKKTKSAGKESTADDSDLTSSKSSKTNKSKKDKKNKKKTSKTCSSDENDNDEDRAAKKAQKAQRKAEKEERRAEKEARRAEKEERRRKKEAKRAAKSSSNTPAAIDSTPSSGSATPQPFVGRHAVRQRYIAAKGRAHLDPQALKEIFMVKAA